MAEKLGTDFKRDIRIKGADGFYYPRTDIVYLEVYVTHEYYGDEIVRFRYPQTVGFTDVKTNSPNLDVNTFRLAFDKALTMNAKKGKYTMRIRYARADSDFSDNDAEKEASTIIVLK